MRKQILPSFAICHLAGVREGDLLRESFFGNSLGERANGRLLQSGNVAITREKSSTSSDFIRASVQIGCIHALLKFMYVSVLISKLTS